MRLIQKTLVQGGGPDAMPERVDRYRLNAEKCAQLAQNFNDPEAKRALLVMGKAWLMLAAQREKKIEAALASEPMSQTNEPPPPPHEPPAPPPIDDLPKPPPINDPPPVTQPPPQRLNTTKPDDPMQC